jgi:UDP-2,4-diacetamido-2,4,6-trideoxy-beta-L-altropyranose hydrolase
MRIAIRVDASRQIGTGHLRRCLSIAEALARAGAEVRFVSREHDDVGRGVFGSSDFPMTWLPPPTEFGAPPATNGGFPPHLHWAGVDQTFDALETIEALTRFEPHWLVIDHYAFDATWHGLVRQVLGSQLMAIDDLGDRTLKVDVLVDANPAADHRKKYSAWLRPEARLLGGPRYAILSNAYLTSPRYVFRSEVRSLGIFMGGTDPCGASARVLHICRDEIGFAGPIEVVSTSANPNLHALRSSCDARHGVQLTLDLPDLSGFYARHDVQIGAGGTATYERCRMGAPSVAIAVAANQLTVIPVMKAAGILRVARLDDLPNHLASEDAEDLASAVRALIADPEARRDLSEKGRALIDGRGTDRIALCLLAPTLGVRTATLDDGQMLHAWRDHPETRAMSGNSASIPLDGHMEWLASKLADADCRLFVAEIGGTAVGSIRFDRQSDEAWEVSLYLDPDLTGLGLGRYLLQAGERAMRMEVGDVAFTAIVMPGNETSARLFTNAGYSGGPRRYDKRVAEQRSEP